MSGDRHEVGHVLVGGGHPEDWPGAAGVAPLPGTDHRMRLMSSGSAAGANPGDLLVKKEWDEAEGWFRRVVEGEGP